MFDYVSVSTTQADRAVERVDHLHVHVSEPAVGRRRGTTARHTTGA
jgi:L-fuconate dehydratase